ncbi:MAG: type II secretion system F family protein [bacterium]
MAARMKACPHCGEMNSERKAECYKCRQPMTGLPQITIPARVLHEKQKVNPEQGTIALPKTEGKTSPLPKFKIPIFPITLRQKSQYYRQMQSLLHAGVPITLAMNYMEKNVAFSLRVMARTIADEIKTGKTLSECMAVHTNIFTEWEIALVKAAELTGALPEIMRQIADTLDLEHDLRARVNSATWSLKATAWVAVLVGLIISGVGTTVGDMEATFNALRNTATQFIILVAVFLVIREVLKSFAQTKTGARIVQTLAVKTPMIGPIIRYMQRIRFARVLSAMFEAGINPGEALVSAARASDDPVLFFRAQEAEKRLQAGEQLTDILTQLEVFPPEMIGLIKAGEMSGSMGQSLLSVASYMEVELEARVKTLPMKLQMLFYAIMVPIVLFILIAFYTRYFESVFNLGGG